MIIMNISFLRLYSHANFPNKYLVVVAHTAIGSIGLSIARIDTSKLSIWKHHNNVFEYDTIYITSKFQVLIVSEFLRFYNISQSLRPFKF